MTRDQQLVYCKVCKNQKFDVDSGIICGLTGRQAEFDPTCKDFKSEVAIEEVQFKTEKVDVSMHVASAGKRFANYCIDVICLLVLYFLFGIGSALIVVLFFPEAADRLESDLDFGYYTILESSSGRTVGKLITGTRVVDVNGKIPGVRATALRSLSRFVPFEAFSFLGAGSRGWHDTWTKTYVVDPKK